MATDDTRGLQHNYEIVFATAAVFTTLSVTTTILRIVSKSLTKARWYFEDIFAILAQLIFICIEGLMCRAVYVGAKVKEINDPEDQIHTMYIYIYGNFYFPTMAFSMLSILFFYRRVFAKRSIRITTTLLIVSTLLWWIPCTIISIIYPNNLPQTFKGNPMQPQLHINYLNFWLGVGIGEQLILLIAVMLPLTAIKGLQMNRHKKVFHMLVFTVSYACIGTGIARLGCLYRPNGGSFDPSLGDIFQNVHLGTAIMSVNLPLCWPVVSQRKKLRSLLSSGSSASRSEARSESTSSQRTPSNARPEVRRPSDETMVESGISWPKNGDGVSMDVESLHGTQESFDTEKDNDRYSSEDISVVQTNQSSAGSYSSRDRIMPKAYRPAEYRS